MNDIIDKQLVKGDIMWIQELKNRKKLDLPKDMTFGLEIEFAKADRTYVEDEIIDAIKNNKLTNNWLLENEETLYEEKVFSIYGGEAISGILTDSNENWKDVKLVCDTIKKYRGIISDKCAAHVHVGANVFLDNLKYYSRLAKLWTVYEDIIIRFCYGESNEPRPNMEYFAKSNFEIFKYIDLFYKNDKQIRSFDDFLRAYSPCKNLAISFRRLDEKFIKAKYGNNIKNWQDYRTFEFRLGNGTLNENIWQNYTNLYTKILLCCLDDNKDWDKIDKKFYEIINNETYDIDNNYNLEKAIEFCNFVFDNELDKMNFLLQYAKNDYAKKEFQEVSKCLVKRK